MDRFGGDSAPLLEWLVLGMVVLATATINIDSEPEPQTELEVTHLSGTVILSTQSSLQTLGLGEFDRGAVASVDMDVNSVISAGCPDCSTTPIGVQLQGNVTITELTGGAAGLGRIEATLSITHLQEYVDENYITREWIAIDWNAGDASSEWELAISHNPLRWQPGQRSNAAFIPNAEGEQTRTGPWILVESMFSGSKNVSGCLPDSFTCDDFTRPDINLTTTMEPIAPATVIPHPTPWVQMQNESGEDETPTAMEDFRQMFEVGEQIEGGEYWCTEVQDEVISTTSWQVSAFDSVSIAPMGIWIDALGLPSSSFTPESGIWSEVETNNRVCATLTDESGVLRFWISTK